MATKQFEFNHINYKGTDCLHYFFQENDSICNSFCINDYVQINKEYPESCIFPHTHSFYLIIWINAGEGIYQVDFDQYKVKAGDILFVRPGMLHCTKNIKDMNGISISFTDFFICNNDIFEWNKLKHSIFGINQEATKCRIPNDESRISLQHDISNLIDEYKDHKNAWGHSTYLKSLLIQLLINLRRYCIWDITTPNIINSVGYDVYLKYEKLVECHFARHHNVSWYASELCTTVKSLNKYTTMYGNMTPHELLNNRVILEAKRFLCFSPFTVSEIASNLGFSDSSNFASFFRKHVNISPLEFRNSHLR